MTMFFSLLVGTKG